MDLKINLNLELFDGLEKVKTLVDKVITVAASYYAENEAAHDFDHALRVTKLALRLGCEESADLELLLLAGILHDTARHEQELTGICHAKRGAEIAGDILLQLGYDCHRTKIVQEMIRTHRFRDNAVPVTLEAKILYDADKLDAIGAIGIGRAYSLGGFRGQKLYTAESDGEQADNIGNYSPVREFHFKLRKIVNKMLTPSGKRLAVHRHEFMEEFFWELEAEVEGQV